MNDQDERERNKEVIRRFVEEVQNQKSKDAYWELNDPNFVNLAPLPPGVPADREGGFAYLFGFMNAFPDSRVTIDDMIAEGDQVVTKKTIHGMHTADFAGIPATGNKVTPDTTYAGLLGVVPTACRRGVGTALMEAAMEEVRP